MTTESLNLKNPRINVTFEKTVVELLTEIANNAHQSVSSLVRELTIEALARREDIALSKLGDARFNPTEKRVQHKDAWK